MIFYLSCSLMSPESTQQNNGVLPSIVCKLNMSNLLGNFLTAQGVGIGCKEVNEVDKNIYVAIMGS